jgi:hypothetical protein
VVAGADDAAGDGGIGGGVNAAGDAPSVFPGNIVVLFAGAAALVLADPEDALIRKRGLPGRWNLSYENILA